MRGGVGSPTPDPFLLYGAGNGFASRAGKAFRSPLLNAGELTAIFGIWSQSNGANNMPTPYAPINASKIDNLSIFDGAMVNGTDPLIGCDGSLGNLFTRVADKWINAGKAQRAILVPVGVSATSISQWAQNTGELNVRLRVMCRRLAARGLPLTAMLTQHGESDTNLGTSEADYRDGLLSVIDTVGDEGFDCPWFVSKSTYYTTGTVSAAVRAACDDVLSNNVFAGPDTDTLTGSYRQPGGSPHFSDIGADAAADLWVTALSAHL